VTTTPQLFAANTAPADFARAYFRHLGECLAAIDTASIDAVAKDFVAMRESGHRLFVAGNGGSAATASHMVCDLSNDVARKAALDEPFRVIALSDNMPILTAVGNDVSFEHVFVAQLRAWFQAGDRLLVISASGNSPNLVRAAEWVKERGGRVIAFVGFDGGRLREIADLAVHVPTERGEYGVVEDAHLVLNHVIANWLLNHLMAPSAR
jgi:D-sedoheptulose 7-phosphate isomerase